MKTVAFAQRDWANAFDFLFGGDWVDHLQGRDNRASLGIRLWEVAIRYVASELPFLYFTRNAADEFVRCDDVSRRVVAAG